MRLRNILLYLLMVASIAPIRAGRLIDDLTIDHDAGRMTVGLYGEGDDLASNANRFSEGMEYDAHGSVTSIVRYGKISSSGYGLMDSLTLSYDGNRLIGVTEEAADYDVTGSFEYKRANGTEYIYDSNGSLVADRSRGIAYIAYDANNNPSGIYFTNGNVTKYVYSATGEKLRSIYYTAMPYITRTFGVRPPELAQWQTLYADSTDYLLGGSLTLKNGRIDKCLFDGGYAWAVSTGAATDRFVFYYYNKDHLGNNLTSAMPALNIGQEQGRHATGYLTGQVVYATGGEALGTVTVYDRKGQAVRTVRKGLGGHIEDAGTGYTFTGEKLRVTHTLL